MSRVRWETIAELAMNRFLKTVFSLALIFFGRQIYASLISGPSGASSAGASIATPRQPGWITQKFAGLLQNVSGAEISPHDMRLLSVLIFIYSFVVGLIVHLVLGDRAFGRAINGLIALLGAGAAIFFLNWAPSETKQDGLTWMVAATIFSSFLLLGAAVALKAFIATEAEDFALGNGTRTGGAFKALTKGTSRNQVSQDRIQRALRRS